MELAAGVARHQVLGVAVSYGAPDGGLLTADLAEAWCVPFERSSPVRALVSYKGQRNFTRSWWCATTGSHIPAHGASVTTRRRLHDRPAPTS